MLRTKFLDHLLGTQWHTLLPSDDGCRAIIRRHQSLPPFGRLRDKIATDAEIIENCDTMKHLLVELDIAFTILRMPFGTPEEENYTMLEEALVEVKRLWNVLGLSHTVPQSFMHLWAMRCIR
jgi:hypothetical protein